MPEIEAYRKTSWISMIPFVLATSCLVIASRRSGYISHSDPSLPEKKIDKIRTLLDHLLAKFQDHFYPSKDLSLDETMVTFRGRFDSTQYTPNKSVKWSIKAFTLADAKTGYMLNILVYTGRPRPHPVSILPG